MTDKDDALIARLRGNYGADRQDDRFEAADRIAALKADNAGYEMALRAASNDACRLQDMANGLRIEIAELRHEMDLRCRGNIILRAERDAARAELAGRCAVR